MPTPPKNIVEHRSRALQKVNFGVLTISSSRTVENDTGGSTAKECIQKAGGEVCHARIVADDFEKIRSAVGECVSHASVEAIVLTGGTGISPKDLTPDALSSLFELELPGFGELFRLLSYQEIGTAALLSRAAAGVVGRKPIFALPGSPAAVRLGLERIVLPEIGHILAELRRKN